MDWSSLTPLIAGAAPTIGGLLGGLIPFPGGAILGQVAGKVLAEALGVPPTPEAVKEAIETRDTAEVQARLSEAEVRMRTEVERFKAQLEDVQDARATTLGLATVGSNIAWGAPVVSVLVVLGFFLVLILFMFVKNELPQNTMLLIGGLLGVLTQGLGQVINYWLGSSVGSKDKTDTIAQMATGSRVAAPVRKK